MRASKKTDFVSTSLLLAILLFSLGTGFLLFYPRIPLSFGQRLLISIPFLLIIGIFSVRILNSRVLRLVERVSKDKIQAEVKKLEAKIDSTSTELQTLNRELKRRVYELHNLFQISMDLTGILDLDRLINSFLNTLLGQLGTKSAVLFLARQSEDGKFGASYFKGFSKKEIENLNFNDEDPLITYFREDRKPIVIPESKRTLRLGQDLEKLEKIGAEVCAPIIHSHQFEGMISIGSKINGEPYNPTEIEMFALLANMASVAISNAQLYQKVERISITDSLTGLYNFRYFEKQLKREVSRARRNNRFVSLVIIDVDHFKNYNDSLGHPAGDKVLKQLAHILENSVRDTDIVARYGGEEFCVILPEVGAEGAFSFGERLRKKVEEFPFEHEHVQPGGKVTISLGSASFPTDAKMVKELIVKADTALYRAKKSGRNNMCLYSKRKIHQ